MSPGSFAGLRRDLAGRNILSVYIAAEEHDPRLRSSWRTRLRNGLDLCAASVDPVQKQAFTAARSAVEKALSPYTGFLPGRAQVLFADADGIVHASVEAVPLPDVVRWQNGPVLGPLARALRQDRAVVVALIDSQRARLFEYRDGVLQEQVAQRADAFIDDMTDRNMSKRAATTSGVRGETATDAAGRIMRVELERLARDVAEAVLQRGGATVVLGGPADACSELEKQLRPMLGERICTDESLQLSMSAAELLPHVEAAASGLTTRLQRAAVEALREGAATGMATLEPDTTLRAGALGMVDHLFFTQRGWRNDEDGIEKMIAATLDHGGTVELLTDALSELLAGAGSAARLRYPLRAAMPMSMQTA